MNEPANESQPTQTNQNNPALAGMCQVCGGECRIQATMCDKCENTLRGWIHDYPIWIHALREFLDSTAHYGAGEPAPKHGFISTTKSTKLSMKMWVWKEPISRNLWPRPEPGN